MNVNKIFSRERQSHHTNRIKSICLPLLLLILVGCSSINCPLNNTVYTLYKLEGIAKPLSDTLTISTMRSIDGGDTVLINLQVNTDSFELPMSYTEAQDIFLVETRDTIGGKHQDTITVSKTNEPHFESVDCKASYFHTITGINYTNNSIDSIKIANPHVNYDASKAHFLIYFKPRY